MHVDALGPDAGLASVRHAAPQRGLGGLRQICVLIDDERVLAAGLDDDGREVLGAGGHVRKDLPALMTQLQAQHSQVDWQLAAAVGETDILVDALAHAAEHLAGLSQP